MIAYKCPSGEPLCPCLTVSHRAARREASAPQWVALEFSHYADVESFLDHYADEIEGRAEYLDPPQDAPPPLVSQPSLFGDALR